jgi:hypothetical protein
MALNSELHILKQVLYHLQSVCALVILEMGVFKTIYLGWFQTSVLLILASQWARTTGVSHKCLTWYLFLMTCVSVAVLRTIAMHIVSLSYITSPTCVSLLSCQMVLLMLLIFWQYWGLNSGPCDCWAGTLPLKTHTSPFCFFLFFQVGPWVFFCPGQPGPRIFLHLLCSWDHLHDHCAW